MYQDIKPLHPDFHGNVKLKPLSNFEFSAKAHAIPVVGPEFREVAREYVIAFTPIGESGEYGAMAALGLREGENLYLKADGMWDATYVPIFLRRYPFLTSEMENGEAIVCIDEEAVKTLSSEDGLPLFENGEPTADIKATAQTLFRIRDDAKRDREWLKQVAAAGLLRSVSASAELPSGQSVSMDGMWVVDEDKLREISAEQAQEWLKNGVMSLIYAHLLSLGNLPGLASRLRARETDKPAA
ncbi:MAG: SapC family protein [Burkholderiales bacterium]|nr:SapC family protein [Burkholderiales bacterium]